MPKISTNEVARIAHLARIALSEPETKQLAIDLSSILNYVAKLQAVNVKNVAITSQVTGLKNVWRSDKVQPSLSHESAIMNAQGTKDGYIKVKKVL